MKNIFVAAFCLVCLLFSLPMILGCGTSSDFTTYSPDEKSYFDEYTLQVQASEFVTECIAEAGRHRRHSEDMESVIYQCRVTADELFARHVRGVTISRNYHSSFVPCSEVHRLPREERHLCP